MRAETSDPTKTYWYAATDLVVKIITAIALAALGYAGWQLQSRAESAQEAESNERWLALHAQNRHERAVQEQRVYLPLLRNLTEVDLALVEDADEFAWPTRNPGRSGRKERLGDGLAFVASALYFPDTEPQFDVSTAEFNINGTSPKSAVTTSARSAILMLAELMRLASSLEDWSSKHKTAIVSIDDEGEIAVTARDSHGHTLAEDAFPIDERAVVAFKRWLPQPMQLSTLANKQDLPALAARLHQQTSVVIADLVARHRDSLAEQYVKDREDILRSRDSLMSRWTFVEAK